MPRTPDKIELFEAGDSRTLLSAAVANELVRSLNALLAIRGANGITVTKSDGNFVLSIDPDQLPKPPDESTDPAGGGGGGGSIISFRGEWNTTDNYEIDDIVYRAAEIDFLNGQAGAFIAKAGNVNSEPPSPGLGEAENDDWKLFVPLQYPHEYWLDPENVDRYTEIDRGKLVVTSEDGGNVYTVTIDPRVDVQTARGLGSPSIELKIREVFVCDDGVEKKMLVIGSAPYAV